MIQLTANICVELPENAVTDQEDNTEFTVEGKKYYLDSLRFLNSEDSSELNLNIFDIIRITVEED